MRVMVTGGAGYIGSHTVVALLERGCQVVVLDNMSNSHPMVFERMAAIAGVEVNFVEGDIRDGGILDDVFRQFAIDAVIHFAGLKSVAQSVSEPLEYYDNNVAGSLSLLRAMARCGCRSLVFSSSATVYGSPDRVPIGEDAPLRPVNPYGQTKGMVETILRDLAASDAGWKILSLRYFNPVGAHPSGFIGEDPRGIPNNLMPYVAQVAVGRLPRLQVYGGDYPTRDGTGVRDYIHVVDLAAGHLAALDGLAPGYDVCNLGTGRGYSVLEVVAAFAAASGRPIDYDIVDRRSGDVAECYADIRYSQKRLNWSPKLDLAHMVADHWRWQKDNPHGYGGTSV